MSHFVIKKKKILLLDNYSFIYLFIFFFKKSRLIGSIWVRGKDVVLSKLSVFSVF